MFQTASCWEGQEVRSFGFRVGQPFQQNFPQKAAYPTDSFSNNTLRANGAFAAANRAAPAKERHRCHAADTAGNSHNVWLIVK